MGQRRVAGTYDDWSFEELVDDWFGGLNKAMRKVRELLQEEDPQAAQDLDDSYDVVEDYFGREMLIEWLEEDDDEFSRGAAIDVPEINGIFTAWDGTEVPISVTEDGTVLCAWFAGCTNPATDIAEHPVLCEVPVCAEHYEFAKGASTRGAVVTGWTQEDGPIYSFNEQVWAQRFIGNDEPFSLAVDTDTGTMLFLGIVHDEEVDVNVDEFAYGDSIPLGEPLLDWITANVLTRDSIRGNTIWVALIKGYGS